MKTTEVVDGKITIHAARKVKGVKKCTASDKSLEEIKRSIRQRMH